MKPCAVATPWAARRRSVIPIRVLRQLGRRASQRLGREPEVALLPEPDKPDVLARVTLGRERAPGEADEILFRAIANRRTNRQPFATRPVPDALASALETAAASEGARLVRIAEDDVRNGLADLVARPT
jgi:hypothetical protein